VNSQFDDESDPTYKSQHVRLISNDESRKINPTLNSFVNKKTSTSNTNNVRDIADFSNTGNNQASNIISGISKFNLF
jgi:hypothetical protein